MPIKPPDASGDETIEKKLTKNTRIQSSTLGKLILKDSPSSDLLKWNNVIPKTISEWIDLLDGGTQKVSGLLIPFSLAPQFTSLESPRVVLTAPEGSAERGKVFLGITQDGGDPIVEFISWNSERRAFDFGTIEQHLGEQKVTFANEPTCFSCHRSRSPIFPAETWDNTVVNRSVLAAFIDVQATTDSDEFQKLNDELQGILQRDNHARTQNPPVMDDFIDYQLQKSPLFSQATYKGFPFVDPLVTQAFDFNQAIFEAHALVVAADWLQTLPNQTHASQIINDRSLELINKYPEHYKTLPTYKSPYLNNFNIVAGEINIYHSINDVIPYPKNIDAVKQYNNHATARQKHSLPLEHSPTNTSAFNQELSNWQDYLNEEMIDRAFGDTDVEYTPGHSLAAGPSEEKVSHDQLCSNCHDGTASSPDPDFSSFNPLSETAWSQLFAKNHQDVEENLCMSLSRICSTSSPMPPSNSAESKSFSTYLKNTVLSLQTLIERHQVDCGSEIICEAVEKN